MTQATLRETTGTAIHATIEIWSYPEQQFDLVTSRLALHYVEDIAGVFAHVYRALVPGGRFIFSLEHPVITSCDRAWRTGGVRQDWTVDDYFETGRRVTSWMGGEVIKFHRTVEDYFGALREADFQVDAVRESRPKTVGIRRRSDLSPSHADSVDVVFRSVSDVVCCATVWNDSHSHRERSGCLPGAPARCVSGSREI